MHRRGFLSLLSLAAPLVVVPRLAWPAPAPRKGASKKTLVLVLQRGAADGLSMVPPIGDPKYAALRPTIAVPPKDAKPLSGPFALHPGLAALLPAWSKGALAIVHAAGSPDPTRSHFDAQDYLETGTPGYKSTDEGFLARALGGEPRGSLRAVAVAPSLPRVLHGDPDALAFGSLEALDVPGKSKGTFEAMYQGALDAALRGAGEEAFAAIERLKHAKVASLEPANGAKYPEGIVGKRLRQVAQLIRSEVGVEVAVVDTGGWDTHVNQAPQLDKRLAELGDALAAFATDLGPSLKDTCLVTATEFGRTVKENGSGGTDHGHGSVMLVLGGGVKGRRVIGPWKGLDDLWEGRDLPVTTDHRSVFSEILRAHLGLADPSAAFPGFTPSKVGLF